MGIPGYSITGGPCPGCSQAKVGSCRLHIIRRPRFHAANAAEAKLPFPAMMLLRSCVGVLAAVHWTSVEARAGGRLTVVRRVMHHGLQPCNTAVLMAPSGSSMPRCYDMVWCHRLLLPDLSAERVQGRISMCYPPLAPKSPFDHAIGFFQDVLFLSLLSNLHGSAPSQEFPKWP